MNSYAITLSAALANERHRDLIRAAARSQVIADLPARDQHETPRYRAPWWSRATSRRVHRAVSSGT